MTEAHLQFIKQQDKLFRAEHSRSNAGSPVSQPCLFNREMYVHMHVGNFRGERGFQVADQDS